MIPFTKDHIVATYFEAELDAATGRLQLLPYGHARHFPLAFNTGNKEILQGETNFFNSVLHKNFKPGNFIDPALCDINLQRKNNALVIYNCLDNCFGHALLKLFYAGSAFDKIKETHDALFIVPQALQHFVKPQPGLNTLTIKLSFTKLEQCFILNKEIEQVSRHYNDTFLEGTDTYGTFDLAALKQHLNLFGNEAPNRSRRKIIFHYRADYFRMWHGKKQAKHIIALFTFLKPYFDSSVEFVLTGDKDAARFPAWIKDERVNKFSDNTDFHYNRLYSEALICIGLTGSHMLFPALLAMCTVHLHPSFKYKNMGEDVVASKNNTLLSAYQHLYYYGNHNCSDLSPQKLGNLLLFHFQGLLEKEYKIDQQMPGQMQWIQSSYPQFNYAKVSAYRAAFNNSENKKVTWAWRFSKLWPF